MENIVMSVKGDKLIIEVDLTRDGVLSATGKTKLVASSRGAVGIDYPKRAGMSFALNVMAK